MGLMYIFPVSDDASEGDRAEVRDSELILKTYGLPMIFWGYLAAAMSVLFLMWMASRAVIAKLLSYHDDPTLLFLGHLVQWTLILTPVITLAFFFYEKIIVKKGTKLSITHKIFFIPVFKRTYELSSSDSISVNHFLASPNMAKLRASQGLTDESMKHFENKGYFELCIKTNKKPSISIDRHSRKADLLKMKELLSRY